MLEVAEKADSPEDTSYLNPVVLKNVLTVEQVNELQTKHLQTNYPEYKFYARHLWLVGTKLISRLSLIKDDETKVIMFDVSDDMKEYRKTHQLKLTKMSPFVKQVEQAPL